MASEPRPRNIVIVGGGIIGCTCSYFLTRHPSFDPSIHKITIIEATAIASGASGKAGGLLALWAYPANIVKLSYQLHAELAQKHDGAKRWGYRAVHCGSLRAKGRIFGDADGKTVGNNGEEWKKLPKTDNKKAKSIAAGIPKDLDWFDAEAVKGYSEMGTPSTTAQVHPYQFTTSMADLAKEAGAKIILGSVTAVDSFGDGVKGVTYEDKDTKHIHTLPATDVILAAGPWTSHVYPEAPIEAMRAHSVVIKADVTPYAVFSEIDLPKDFGRTGGGDVKKKRHGLSVSPEMYARPDGTVYACGEGDTLIPLPKTSDLVVCDEDRCQDIIDYCVSISTPMREGDVLARQACYLPSVAGGGGPLIGETGTKGLFMATGHTCWGIQNSCATGKLISEFVFDGKAKSAKIDSLDPRRFL
ncbi:FAD dependent oxidoreductase [Mollisia scopiformis]|uniref:FAD dependent oxidoreductase n=1 Tax=Mollisia scopiformis TaxID=149040 RepID=A0A194XHS1_MOLSC|nr:FAD dependent oxidoreductase [Mollisia scopiformis]KUJ19765.1 FAD dependent oxidoreductase [Mollisia scopiformis]